MREIVFLVEDALEGGFAARALGHSIFTEAETMDALHKQARDAVRVHFGDTDGFRVIPQPCAVTFSQSDNAP